MREGVSAGMKLVVYRSDELISMLNLFFCIRGRAQMVSVGLLVVTIDVWTECYSCEWISWT